MKNLLVAIFALAATATFAQGDTAQADAGEGNDTLAERILKDLNEHKQNIEGVNSYGKLVPRQSANLRFLDRLNGSVQSFSLSAGQETKIQHLTIKTDSCYVPADNGASDALAYLQIRDDRDEKDAFDGWMIASSPALSALEHPRYDVWVVSCGDKVASNSTPETATVPPARPADLAEVTAVN